VGFFKNSGVQLTEDQQDRELARLNPRVRSTVPVSKYAASITPTNTKGYLVGSKRNNFDGTQDSEVVGECTNSTGTFVPPYWCFVFSDTSLRDYVCITINIPSGLCSKSKGIEDKVDAKISTCRTKLLVECEWPATLTTPTCMQDALTVKWKNKTSSTRDKDSYSAASTVSNILFAFDKELRKMRNVNRVTTNSMLGSTATISLPFQVEPEMVLCETALDRTIKSANLYVVLKKTVKNQEQHGTKRMGLRISNGLQNHLTTLARKENEESTKSDSDDDDSIMSSAKKPRYKYSSTMDYSSTTTFPDYSYKSTGTN
jgi:hypothetical protein